MLKIKDNVDLKELEKFGFKYFKDLDYYAKNCIGTFNKIIIFNYDDLDYSKGTIIFSNESSFQVTLYLDTLYDLIQAGLVEKVSDK